MDTSQPDPLVGHTLAGSYKILKLIAEEELGMVYDAVVMPQNTPVSVKVLSPNLVEDVEAFGRFGREMLATATIQHPNTVQMIDFGEHRQVFHFIVLERLYARDLAHVMKAEKLGLRRAVHIGAQIASALAAAHREKIVHRNLRPTNILLLDNTEGDYVKVRDFGLARLQDEQGNAEDGGLTEFGVRVGALAYMAPEYIRDGIVEPRGDLYALGVLMYEMLTGNPPFSGMTAALIEAHLGADPTPLKEVDAGVPDWLNDLVMQLLQKEPHKRPRNASEVISVLQANTGDRLAPPHVDDPRAMLTKRSGGSASSRGAGNAAKNKGGKVAIIAVAVLGGLGLIGLVVVLLVIGGVFAVSS